MKLAISMWSYVNAYKQGKLDIAGFIYEAHRLGADGVELLDFFYRDIEADRASAKKALAETGLPCPIFSVAQNFAKATAEEREIELNKIKFGVDEAVHFESQVVRVFAGDVSEGIGFEQARDWIIDGLVAASIYAAQHQKKLALENHGKLAGKSDQVLGIIKDVRAKSGVDVLGANPDTGNFLLCNEVSEDAVANVSPMANMVHFKDFAPAPVDLEGFAYTALDGSKFVGTAIGEGAVNLGECVRQLKAAGFDGWLSLEYEAEEDPFDGVTRSVENARRLMQA